MSRQESLDLILATVIDTMTDLYTRAGISETDKQTYLSQGNESFKTISINIYEKLLENGVVKND